jgi:hypothetical protein
MRKIKLKRDLMENRVKKAIKDLTKISHDFIRHRDSRVQGNQEEIGGHCFDCGKLDMGQFFQCGHWQPNGGSGAILRFHPHNMHGQSASCNTAWQQERVKIDYTFAMIKKYGIDRVEQIKALRNKTIKADILFYEKMIELYKAGDEQEIVNYLESL